MGIISWIILGALAGWIAGFITKGGFGFWGDILAGIVGAVIAGFITQLVFPQGDLVTGLNFTSLIVAIIGAAVVILVVRALGRGRVTA